MSGRRSHCKQCGRPDDEVGRISKRGLCRGCGHANLISVNTQLAQGYGPQYNLYVKRQQAGMDRYLERLQRELDERYRRAEQGNT